MKILRILLKTGAYLSLLLIFLYLLLIIYLHMPAGEKQLANYTSELLQGVLSADIEIKAVQSNLISNIEAEKLTVTVKGDTLLHFRNAKISYSLFSVLSGKLILNDIEIGGLTACVQRDSGGVFQFEILNPDTSIDKEPSTFEIIINNLSIRNSRLCYADRSIPLNVKSDNVHANMTLSNGKFSFNADFKNLFFDYFEEPLISKTVDISAVISDSGIQIDSFNIIFPDFSILGSLYIGFKDNNPIKGTVHANGRPYVFFKSLISPQILAKFYKNEKTSFDIALNGDFSDLSILSSISKLTLFSIPISNVNTQLKLKDETIYIRSMILSLFGGKISGDGLVSYGKDQIYSFAIKAENIKTASLLASGYGDIPLRNLTINGNINSSGNLADIKNINLTSLLNFTSDKSQKNNFSTDINISDGKGDLCIKHSENNCAKFSIRLQDHLGSGIFHGIIDSVDFFTYQLNLPPVNGTVFYDGTFNRPDVYAQIRARSLRYKNFPLDTIYAQLNYTDSGLTFKRLYISSTDTLINPYNLNELSAFIHYSGEFSGKPDNLNGNMRALLNDFNIKEYHLDTIFVKASLKKSLIHIDTASVEKNNARVALKGNIDIKNQLINFSVFAGQSDEIISAAASFGDSLYRLSMAGNDIRIQEIRPFIPHMPALNGKVDFNLTAISDTLLKSLQAKLQFFTQNLIFNNTKYADSLKIAAEFGSRRLSIDTLRFFLHGETASAEMIFQFSDSVSNRFEILHSEGHIRGNNIDLEIFNPFLPHKYSARGNSQYNLSWSGSYSEPGFDGFLTVRDGKILSEDETLINDINISFSISDSLINIDSIAFSNNNIPVTTKGRFEIYPDKIDITLKSSIPNKDILTVKGYTTLDSINIKADVSDFSLSFLNPLLPELHNLSGKLSSSVNINGNIKDPFIDGGIQIGDFSFEQEYVEAPVKNGMVQIRFVKDRAFIDTLLLPVKKGYLALSGNIGFDTLSLSNFDIKAVLRNIELDKDEAFHLYIPKGDLQYITERKLHNLSGEITFGESKFYRDLKLDDLWKLLLTKSKSTYTNETASDLDVLTFYEDNLNMAENGIPDFIKNTNLDIVFKNRGDLWVYNNVADFYLTFDLTLSGEIINPSIIGRINMEEDGKMNFLDRVFEIKKGTFEFLDPKKINPVINLSADSEIEVPSANGKDEDTYLINLLIDGPLDQMNFTLTSQPSMDPSDIISLLTLGMTYNEIATLSGNTESSDALKKRSGEIAGQIISQKMNSYLKKVLGNKGGDIELEIQGDIFDVNDTRVAVNKRWGKHVTVSYSTSIKDFDKRIIHIGYKINKNFSIEGQTNQDQESSIDLKYRIRFK